MKIITAILIFSTLLFAQTHSLIVTAEGVSALGNDKSRDKTKQDALVAAKRAASEQAGTYIKSETTVNNFVTEHDLLESFSEAEIKVLKTVKEEWFKDELTGESFRIVIEAEVIPAKKSGSELNIARLAEDPTSPLTVNVWCDKTAKIYQNGEVMKLYLKGNKPFYARILYKQADGTLLQLLPNPQRTENYFNGGVTYELPAGKDQYTLEVSAPFGNENIIVYASTAETGSGSLENSNAVYTVKDDLVQSGIKTRGLKIKTGKDAGSKSSPAEFFETGLEILTKP